MTAQNGPPLIPAPGDRIRLLQMPDDPHAIAPDSCGTVTYVYPHSTGSFTQIGVRWDNGRGLMLCVPPDTFEPEQSK